MAAWVPWVRWVQPQGGFVFKIIDLLGSDWNFPVHLHDPKRVRSVFSMDAMAQKSTSFTGYNGDFGCWIVTRLLSIEQT